MKKLLLLLIILLSGCSTLKKSEKETTKISVKNNTEIKSDSEAKTSGSTIDKTNQVISTVISSVDIDSTEMNIKIVDYDTNKPVIESTGKPPVLRETTISKRNHIRHQSLISNTGTVNKDIKSNYTILLKSHRDSLNSVNTSLISNSRSKESYSGFAWYKWLILGIGVSGLIWLIFKFKWYKFLSFLWQKLK